MQPAPPLPFEMAMHIIDYLYDCPTSLKKCSRVCRAWLAISRSHLFYSISFDLSRQGVSNHLRRLHSAIEQSPIIALEQSPIIALEQSPIIALYIRELTILHGSQMRMSDSDWVNLVPLLFGKITSLQKLEVAEVEWNRLMPIVRSSVRDLLALPSLVHFSLASVTVSRIEHFTAILPPNLKLLTVDRVYVQHDDAEVTHAIDLENVQMSTQNPRQLECTLLLISIIGFLERSQTLTYRVFAHWTSSALDILKRETRS
jgi:hypothetical protein